MRFKVKSVVKGLLFCWGMAFYSCENDSSATNDLTNKDKTIINARKYFENNKPNLEALEYTKAVDWKNAILLNNNGQLAVEVPLQLLNNTSTNVLEDKDYKTYMRLLFIKNIDDTYNSFNIVYTTKDKSFNNNDKSFNILDIGSKYSGYITIQKSDNKISFSAKYINGELFGLHNFDQGQSLTSRLECTYYVTVENYTTCSNWVWLPDYISIPGGFGNLPFGYMPGITGPLFPNGIPPFDPCLAAVRASMIASNAGFISARAAVVQAGADGNEHSITLGTPSSGVYSQSVMRNGGTNGVAVSEYPGAMAAIHNHPNNTPLSSGDIYAAVTLNTKSSAFYTSIIVTGGETYAIVVNNLPAAQNFVKNYPPDLLPNYPPEFPNFIFDQIDAMKDYMGYNIEGRTSGIAFILDKYDAGITLLKQNSKGEFYPLTSKEITQNGSKTYTLTPCN
ncbi:hypothetical protein [[Flexibacter] sp. ATCC 35103]|uniref:hypothetical protein n=1 Tax=[Flexibacter] sp. ATCC 35103 TaxID=1937528 RepID=UPI0009CE3F0D|nr:hypothetical protein [[Flexibacter] sp. ATCC 35103]OMQ09093.1 hypothetical protein BXU01_19295 [[Flexibacter] sp. ATCC 35103]